jgi:hypothetical protein
VGGLGGRGGGQQECESEQRHPSTAPSTLALVITCLLRSRRPHIWSPQLPGH